MSIKNISLFLIITIMLLIFPVYAHAAFSLIGSNSFNGTVSVAMPITDLQISGTGTEPIPVKLRVSSGSLAMSTTTGLTFDGSSTGAEIYFSGSLANLNNALATLTYTRGSTGTDTLEVSLVNRGEVFFSDNNHLYKFISGSISANEALTDAQNQTAYGATGYLATITSEAENNFVAARLQGDGWMGASDVTSEGDWKWISGPEAGTSFWSGLSGGAAVGGMYENWATGEPNNAGNEDCGQFYITTGMWNDLPCSSVNLAGYVVEFGAPGNMPTVAAKNISITTNSNPTVSSFIPSDNATNTTLTSNLIITFSQNINKGTGNIEIKKSSDDTTFETIDVTSGQVTGQGTNTITINPNNTFQESTSYYVNIQGTTFQNATNNYYAGIANASTWNFTTGDFTNPTISNVTSSSITDTAATITWDTSENASTRVRYGLTNAYGSQTAETDTSPRLTTHAASLTSLLSCTTYHFAAVSVDNATNTSTSIDNTFTTTGCPANSTPTNSTTEEIVISSGGSETLQENNSEITIDVPADVTTGASSLVIQIKAVDSTPILSSYGKPTTSPQEVGDIVFDVTAIINGTTILDTFDSPVTISYQYSESEITRLDESTLWLYHYHNSAWKKLDNCNLNTMANTISCTTDGFSIFGLFGQSHDTSNDPKWSPSVGNQSFAPICNAPKPNSTPDLFQIDTNSTQAKLYFTPLHHTVTNYYISYGYAPNELRFGTFTDLGANTGVLSYTVNKLSPNLTYYFKIRPHNDCMPGDWSNEIKVTTTSNQNGGNAYYKSYQPHKLAIFPSFVNGVSTKYIIPDSNQSAVLGAQNSCEYIVQSGDSLWTIAKQKLGSGTNYTSLMSQNNLTSDFINVGMKLMVGCE